MRSYHSYSFIAVQRNNCCFFSSYLYDNKTSVKQCPLYAFQSQQSLSHSWNTYNISQYIIMSVVRTQHIYFHMIILKHQQSQQKIQIAQLYSTSIDNHLQLQSSTSESLPSIWYSQIRGGWVIARTGVPSEENTRCKI